MSRIAVILLVFALAAAQAAPKRNIAATAAFSGSFTTLVKALQAADLVEALEGAGPFTVFAPTDAAFAELPEGAVESLLQRSNRHRLLSVLSFHVVEGHLDAADLIGRSSLKTLSGRDLDVEVREGRLLVQDVRVVKTDIACTNGVIHVIERVLVPEPAVERAEPAEQDPVTEVLALAIDRGVPLFNAGHTEACAAVYEVAATALLASEKVSARDRALLTGALRHIRGESDASSRAWTLRRAFDKILEHSEEAQSMFQPRIEAEMPAGFPAPGPVGRVVVKEYPRYRAARAAGDRSAFWTLFNHIKRNKIEMTAPVEMAMDDNMDMRNMAFLYARPDMGATGREGNVDVIDLEPVRVLSCGIRGPMSPAKVEDAKRAIEAQLNRSGHARAGAWRLLGYNSPMVPADQRFWELQLPVKPSDA